MDLDIRLIEHQWDQFGSITLVEQLLLTHVQKAKAVRSGWCLSCDGPRERGTEYR